MSLFLQERRKIEESVFGLKPISQEEFNAIYEMTGLDLDGRLENVNNCMMYQDALNRKLIGFLKSIPGFKTFDIDDQICLTKGKEYYLDYLTILRYCLTKSYQDFNIQNIAVWRTLIFFFFQ